MKINIVVNGQTHCLEFPEGSEGVEKISFDGVTSLAQPGTSENSRRTLTVTWSRGPGSGSAGSMVPGDSIYVSEGMVFSAIHAGTA